MFSTVSHKYLYLGCNAQLLMDQSFLFFTAYSCVHSRLRKFKRSKKCSSFSSIFTFTTCCSIFSCVHYNMVSGVSFTFLHCRLGLYILPRFLRYLYIVASSSFFHVFPRAPTSRLIGSAVQPMLLIASNITIQLFSSLAG